MSDRSWFYVSNGQQLGPYPETQFREFFATRTVTADTLVWTEGMADWQRAGDIPGLLSGSPRPPAVPVSGSSQPSGSTAAARPLSSDFNTWALFGRSLLYVVGLIFVIPAPWTATSLYRWLVEHLRVPQRPNLRFTGKVSDIWYVFVAMGLGLYARSTGLPYIEFVFYVIDTVLAWMVIRWLVANISPDGSQRPLSFTGSIWGYVGWYLLMFIAVLTIIGWAWVITAWMRWVCRNIQGTRREIVFVASGWALLWRIVVVSFACCLIIPIPWMIAWYARWKVSQFALVERTA